jgi:hypothetical protein
MRNYIKILFLAPMIGACPTFGEINVTAVDFNYSQNFNSLPSTGTTLSWTNNSTISGWYRHYEGATQPPGRDLSVQGTVANQVGFLNVAMEGDTDRALVMRRASFSTEGAFGVAFANNAGASITGFEISYTGEQWRRQTNVASSLYFEYAVVSSLDAGSFNVLDDPISWTRVDSLEFVSPNTAGGGTGLDGRLAANRTVFDSVAVSAEFEADQYLLLRWYQDDVTNNDALGINDFSITMIPEPSTYAMILGFLGLAIAALRRKRRVSSN